ncbi:lectin C-type domain protein [Ostertagia ostertagi]
MATAACVFALLSINPMRLPQLPRVCSNEMCNVKMVDLRKCRIRCRPPLAPGWSLLPSTGYAYFHVKKRATWEEAEKECRKEGATLASVHSNEENDHIYICLHAHLEKAERWVRGEGGKPMANKTGEIAVGLRADISWWCDKITHNFAKAGLSPYTTLWLGRLKPNPSGKGYMWHDNTPLNFTNWAEHHPNNLETDTCVAFYNRRMNISREEMYLKRWIDLCCTKKMEIEEAQEMEEIKEEVKKVVEIEEVEETEEKLRQWPMGK